MVLLDQDPKNALVNEMIAKAKRSYVDGRHAQKISQIHSANIYKDGQWKTYVHEDGKRREILKRTEEELYAYLYKYYKNLDEKPKTFDEAVDLLMARKVEQLNRSNNTISDNRRYFSYVDPAIRKKPLAMITEEDLRKWLVMKYMRTRPKETALRKVLQLLKELFRYGMAIKICFENPAECILPEDYLKDCDTTRRTNEERSFSQEEIVAIREDALRTPDNPRALMTLLAIETGLRAGELAALHVSDVDIKNGYIHVHRQQVRDLSRHQKIFFDVPYTKDERKHPHGGRYVPVTQECRNVLRMADKLRGKSDYLFHDRSGKPITKDSYAHNLHRRCSRLGIEISNNHAFRVAFNSRLHYLGFSPSDRALILGHAVETNERHYSFSDKRRLDLLKERLA